ncbi:MAG TPA: hypothetical protein VL200_11085 [Lacunisphaera sp.]|jgi:hypothetical protein|nr:hypothetical protein [Lacunisphaera sp.]
MISAMVSRSMVKRKRQTRPGMMRRVIAAACVAVVFALGLFAASPVLHGQLHAGSHAPGDDGCAVAVFAGGVDLTAAVVAGPPAAEWREVRYAVLHAVFVHSPAYRLLPGRGPPVGKV